MRKSAARFESHAERPSCTPQLRTAAPRPRPATRARGLRELAAAQTVGAGCGGVRRVRGGEEEGVQARGPAARRPLEGTGTESSAALEGAAWVKFVVGGTAAMQAVRWMWRRRWAGACGGLVVGRSGAWVWLWRAAS